MRRYIFEEHVAGMLDYAQRYVDVFYAEDVVQEARVWSWRHSPKYVEDCKVYTKWLIRRAALGHTITHGGIGEEALARVVLAARRYAPGAVKRVVGETIARLKGQGFPAGVDSPEGYAYGAARNVAMNYTRDLERRIRTYAHTAEPIDPAEYIIAMDLIAKTLRRCPPAVRVTLRLYINGVAIWEIADKLACTHQTVYGRLRSAGYRLAELADIDRYKAPTVAKTEAVRVEWPGVDPLGEHKDAVAAGLARMGVTPKRLPAALDAVRAKVKAGRDKGEYLKVARSLAKEVKR